MDLELEFCKGVRMLDQRPWARLQILHHGNPLQTLIDQAAPSIQFDDLSGFRRRDACLIHEARDPRFILHPVGRAPVAVEFQDVLVIPQINFSRATFCYKRRRKDL